MLKALKVLNFSGQNTEVGLEKISSKLLLTDVLFQQSLFSIVASILHLGNVTFSSKGQGHATIKDQQVVQTIAKVKYFVWLRLAT